MERNQYAPNFWDNPQTRDHENNYKFSFPNSTNSKKRSWVYLQIIMKNEHKLSSITTPPLPRLDLISGLIIAAKEVVNNQYSGFLITIVGFIMCV